MVAPRKYPEELRERAVRMAVDARRDPVTRPGALQRVGEQLGINPETLRGWVNQAEVDAGQRPGTTTSDAQRLVELERENRELRRSNAMADSSGGRNEFCELLRWCHVAQRLAGTTVQAVLDTVQLRAADEAEVGALGQVLTQEPVGVLVAAALPG